MDVGTMDNQRSLSLTAKRAPGVPNANFWGEKPSNGGGSAEPDSAMLPGLLESTLLSISWSLPWCLLHSHPQIPSYPGPHDFGSSAKSIPFLLNMRTNNRRMEHHRLPGCCLIYPENLLTIDSFDNKSFCKLNSFFKSIYFYLFIYLFMAALGLRCCARAFSSCGERVLLFIAVHGLLIAVASLVAEHRL